MHQQIDASRQGAFPCAAALGVFPPAAGFARRAAGGDRRFQLPQLLAWLGLGLGLGLRLRLRLGLGLGLGLRLGLGLGLEQLELHRARGPALGGQLVLVVPARGQAQGSD